MNLLDPNRVTPTRLIQLTGKWRLSDSAPTVMLPGRLTAWKGHDVLIDALAVMKSRRGGTLDVRCLMVGQDQGRVAYRAHIERHAAARGVEGHVQIIDDCNDMAAAYMATDVVVSASTRPEAFGRVVAEAQAMGRPVVAPSHGAAPRRSSYPASPAGCSRRAIRCRWPTPWSARCASPRMSASRLAETAIARARELFSKADMCAKTIKAVYDEVLACSAVPQFLAAPGFRVPAA